MNYTCPTTGEIITNQKEFIKFYEGFKTAEYDLKKEKEFLQGILAKEFKNNPEIGKWKIEEITRNIRSCSNSLVRSIFQDQEDLDLIMKVQMGKVDMLKVKLDKEDLIALEKGVTTTQTKPSYKLV